jgi:hypothetical protein
VDRAVCRPTARHLPGGGIFLRHRVRMVGETNMNRHNGSISSPPNGVAQGMAELTRDILSLVELQFELFRKDCRNGFKRLLFPLAMLLLAGIVAAATVPIALILMAELLVQAAGLSQATAFSIATLSGFLAAVALGLVGWFYLRRVGHVFERSRAELTRNMTWIEQALTRPAPNASEQPQER